MAFSATFKYQILDRYSVTLKKMQKATSSFRTNLYLSGKTIDKLGNKLGKMSTKLANLRTGFAAMVLTRGLKSMVSGSIEFEQSMNAVEGRVKPTVAQLKELRRISLALGADTKFTAAQVAEGMSLLGLQGYKFNAIMKLTPEIATLATASVLEFAETSDMLTGVLKMYSMEADKAGMVSDVLSITATNSATSVTQLVSALKNAGPMGHMAGIGFKETSAILGVMGNKMLRSGAAGTKLMNAIRDLIVPTEKAKKTLLGMGIGKDFVTDFEGRIVSLIDLIEVMEKKGFGIEDIFKTFKFRGAQAFGMLVGESPAIRELLDMYERQIDASKRLSDIITKGVVRSAFEASSAFQNMKLVIAKTLEPLTIWVMGIVDAFSTFVINHPNVARTIGVLWTSATVLLTVITIVGVVLSAISSFIILFGAWTLGPALMSFASGGMAAVTAGAAATVTMGSLAVAMWAFVGPALIVAALIATIVFFWEDAVKSLKILFSKQFWSDLGKSVLKTAFWEGISEAIKENADGQAANPIIGAGPNYAAGTNYYEIGKQKNQPAKVEVKVEIDVNDKTGGKVSDPNSGTGDTFMNIIPSLGYGL